MFPGSPCCTQTKTDGNIVMGRFGGLFIALYNKNSKNNNDNNKGSDLGIEIICGNNKGM